MRKSLIAMTLASALTVANVFPAFALDIRAYYGVDSSEIQTTYQDGAEHRFVSGTKKDEHWKWINGYCYYFYDKNGLEMAVNCTTPDGYTVNELGQWTVNGVIQHNGFQNLVVGTDEKYVSKTDEERWHIMHDMLEELYATKGECGPYGVAMVSTTNSVSWGWPNGNHIGHGSANGDYIITLFGNYWNEDCLGGAVSEKSEVMEQTLRILCGDHAGIELFNALHAAALPAEGGPRVFAEYDENGEPTFYTGEDGLTYVKSIPVEVSDDGINFNYMDKKWFTGEMKTDYGKSIIIEPSWKLSDRPTKTPIEWSLIIR